MTKKNTPVLYLSYDGLTDPLGQSQILPYLIGLSKEKYQITIISFEKRDRFEKEGIKISKLCEANNFNWRPLRYHKHPPVLSTLLDFFKMRQLAIKTHHENQFAIVHCRSYVTSLVGLVLKRRFNVKFIFDMRGFWADERVEGGLWNLRNPVYKLIYNFFKKKEKEFISNADCVISLTETARNEILKWSLSNKIVVIPCCVDVDYFDPARIDATKRNLLRKELGIRDNDFVLLYLGSLGTWYLLEDMLSFFTELKKTKSNARFLFITPDKLDARITNNYDIVVRQAAREDVPLFISLSNLAIVFIKSSFSKKASSATKMAELLAMGKPIIVNTGWGDVSAYKDVLSGVTIVSSPADYASGISSLSNSYDPDVIRRDAIENFSLSKGVSLYQEVYQDLA